MAGATSPQVQTEAEMIKAIREAGRAPVQRNTFYEPIKVWDGVPAHSRPARPPLARRTRFARTSCWQYGTCPRWVKGFSVLPESSPRRRGEAVAFLVSRERMECIFEMLEILTNPEAMKAIKQIATQGYSWATSAR